MSDVAMVPESRCLACGYRMNAVGSAQAGVEARPEPGDVAVCIACGAVMKLDDHLRLRGMSEPEMDALVGDKAWMDEIARMVGRVHFVTQVAKHQRG